MTDQIVHQLLAELSAAFHGRHVGRLLALFADHPQVTYAGSEQGERATGTPALASLLTRLLAREQAYAFEFPHPSWLPAGEAIGVLADGTGTGTSRDGAVETFAYRLCGILLPDGTGWRWLLLSGSEPAATDDS